MSLPIHGHDQDAQKTIPSYKRAYFHRGTFYTLFGNNSDTYRIGETFHKHGYIAQEAHSFDNLENPSMLVTFDVPIHQLHNLTRYPQAIKVLFTWEPPAINAFSFLREYHAPYNFIYTWHDDFIDNKKYFKFYYPKAQPMLDNPIEFENKKLCALIALNQYLFHPDSLKAERKKIIEFFENTHPQDFNLFGGWWWPCGYKTYKGGVENKIDALKYYRFAICYENMKNVPGYITEKIFDCFQAACVPVYWGAPNIETYIPKSCFIARTDFSSDEELYLFMKNMNKETYEEYIKNIKIFLASSKAYLYTETHFVEILEQLIDRVEKLTEQAQSNQNIKKIPTTHVVGI